ncbi:MAG: VOC family protein [Gemmatimonadota bacterium]
MAVRVADLDAALDWYSEVFALQEVNRLDRGGLSIRILAGEALSVELIHQEGVRRPEGRHLGLFKSGIFVRDIEGFLARMQAHGVDADDAVFVDHALQMRSFVMRDLEGNRLQLFERCAERCN